MKDNKEVRKELIQNLRELRNFFGEDDKRVREHYLFDLADRCINMVNSIQQPPSEGSGEVGLRWVKASERLPLGCGEGNKVVIKDISETYHFVGEGFRNYNHENPAIYFVRGNSSFLTVHDNGNYQSTWPVKNIEWLEEYTLPSNSDVERFKKPSADKIIKAATLFNDGRMDRKQLGNMVALCYWVVDRLYENGDITIPSSKENKEDGKV